MTYRELDDRASALALRLVGCGVGVETPVALLLERSDRAVVTIMAVLKAGGFYVPIDPTYPASHITRLLTESSAPVVVTDRQTAHIAAEVASDRTLVVMDEPGDTGTTSEGRAWLQINPENLAYLMFTSGSTGVAKGVAVTHQDVVQLALDPLWAGSRERLLWHSPMAFDASTYELWVALLAGGHVTVAGPGHLSVEALERLLRDGQVTSLWLTAGLFHVVVEEAPECLSGLRAVLTGGDVVSPAAVRRVLEHCDGLTVLDGYGPTETTTFATVHRMRAAAEVPDKVPIGRPLTGTRVLVLDHALSPVSDGESGELYIAGAGLARGYWGRSRLTAERFVASPAGVPGERMYRTGDLVRWTDGVLQFLGRVDDQVKIRGHRIELAEVESILSRCPTAGQVLVTAREDQIGIKQLVAYLVTGNAGSPGTSALREYAERELPSYMRPTAFVEIEALPLTPNGKWDRSALPRPRFTGDASRGPTTEHEELLCSLFAEALGVASVAVDDSFVERGGHSLSAVRLVNRIRSVLGVALSIRQLFETPTVAGVAGILRRAVAKGPVASTLAPQQRPLRLPLSFAQRRMWSLDQLQNASAAYNVPVAMRLRGSVDLSALRAALRDVVDRHESLRTVFPADDGGPYQEVLDGSAAQPELTVLACDTDEALARAVGDAARTRFDLAVEIPLRAWLLSRSDTEHVLIVVLHHIAGDGWSLRPLLRDLSVAYSARLGGTTPDWADLPVQYADYVLWQRRQLGMDDGMGELGKELRFWLDSIDGMPEQLELPTDRPRPASMEHSGDQVKLTIPRELHERLRSVARTHHVSMFMLMHAAFAALLTRLGAGTDVPIGVPVAGRDDSALEELVGFFANTLVMRTDTSGDPTFERLLLRVRDTALSAYAHQALPFDQLVEEVNPTRSAGHHPLFQVMVAYDNNAESALELPGLDVSEELVTTGTAKFDLTLILTESQGRDGSPAGVTGALEYADELFERTTAQAICAWLLRFLESVARDPGLRVSEVDLLSPEERDCLLWKWNDTGEPLATETFPARFEPRARTGAEAVAVQIEQASFTYQAVNTRANQLAHLLAGRGVGREDAVAILLPPSVDLVVASLAVMKCGAAALALDPRTFDRDSRGVLAGTPKFGITKGDLAHAAGPEIGQYIALDDRVVVDSLDAMPVTDPSPELSPDNLAFLVQTTATDGSPVDVAVTHRGIPGLVTSQLDLLQLSPTSRVLQLAPPGSAHALWEMCTALLSGSCLVVAPLEQTSDGRAAAEPATRQRVTHIVVSADTLPSMPSATGFGRDVTLIAAGGEPVSAEMVVGRVVAGRVLNAYGRPEIGPYCLLSEAATGPRMALPLGRPSPDTRVYVLDSRLRPAPPGVAGELYIDSDHLARGYLQPRMTATHFVACPFGAPGARMFRTGDLARWRPDGTLWYAGRATDRVLRRGGANDRAALPPPLHAAVDSRTPRSVDEQLMRRLFAEVLGTPDIGVDDNFFALGGDSILAIQLAARAGKSNIRITPQQVLQYQTASALTQVARSAPQGPRPTTDVTGPLPLFPIVHMVSDRGGVLEKLVQSVVVHAPSGLGLSHLRAAVEALLVRHEALRIKVNRSGPSWEFEITSAATIKPFDCVRRIDVAGLHEPALRQKVQDAGRVAVAQLDIDSGRLIQVRWLDAGPGKPGWVMVVAHHLAVDAVSWRILLADLAAACAAAQGGRVPELPPVGTTVRQWAAILGSEAGRRGAEMEMWSTVLAPPRMSVRSLVGSRRDTPAVGATGDRRVVLPASKTAPLVTDIPSRFRAGPQDALVTALAMAFAAAAEDRGLAREPMVIDIEGHGRQEVGGAELSRTMGWFTSVHPVRINIGGLDLMEALSGGAAAGRAMKLVKEQLRAAPDGGLGYGLLRYLNPQTAATLADLPPAEVVFNYLGRLDTVAADEWRLAGLTDDPIHVDEQLPGSWTCPLEVTAWVAGGSDGAVLTAVWSSDPTVVSPELLEELIALWCRALDGIALHAAQARTGGRTPSDLTLLSLTQRDIDLLESDWEG